MKILQIFGAVVAVHLLAFVFIFASPGCQSPTNIPTPDATMPSYSGPAPVQYNSPSASPQPVDLGTSVTTYAPSTDHPVPTRPGSPSAIAVTPAKAAPEVDPISKYTVERGDSLWSIAKKNNISVSELAKMNKFSTGTVLKPGQKLIIPARAGETAAMKEMSVPAAPAEKAIARPNGEGVKHTVQAGETLGAIARKYQVRTADLVTANSITDPSKVRAGQQLIIPGFTPVAAKSKAATPASTAVKSSPTTEAAPAAPEKATAASMTPHFDISAPPIGQDLDAGLKENSTEVPTIRVEEVK